MHAVAKPLEQYPSKLLPHYVEPIKVIATDTDHHSLSNLSDGEVR